MHGLLSFFSMIKIYKKFYCKQNFTCVSVKRKILFMEYQRVTEILEPFSGIKYIDAGVLENAAVRGTKVHNLCEAIMKGHDGWNIPEEYKGYVDSFMQWWDLGHQVQVIEKRFFCNELAITGKVDIMIKNENGSAVVDLKTSAREYKSWMLQGSAYSYLAKKNDFDVNRILFIRLSREGKPPKLHEYEENMPLFRECLNVYRYFYGRKPKKEKHAD